MLGPESEVLILGAGGGMGTFAVQMAMARGATITGVDRATKLELVRSIGADHVIAYVTEDVTRGDGRYDLVFDIQAHRSIRDFQRVLKWDGTHRMVGGSTWRVLQGALLGFMLSRSSHMKLDILPGWPHTQRDKDDVDELIESGAVRPVIDRGEALGKVVVRVAGG